MVQRGLEVNWLKLTNEILIPSIFCVTSVAGLSEINN